MLMTKLKSEEVIGSLTSGKVFIINCHGCKEVGFPEEKAKALQKKLEAEGKVVGILTTDYVCNPDELALRLRAPMRRSPSGCRAGVLLRCRRADHLPDAGGQAGLRLLRHHRAARLSGRDPAGIRLRPVRRVLPEPDRRHLPITACSKSLVNGPCGGTKNGKCEVNPAMDCGWERIIQRLKAQGRLDVLRCPTQMHDFNTDEATKSAKESE